MRFFRRHKPGGDPEPRMSREVQEAVEFVDSCYKDFVIWADAYISLLEKRVQQLEKEKESWK